MAFFGCSISHKLFSNNTLYTLLPQGLSLLLDQGSWQLLPMSTSQERGRHPVLLFCYPALTLEEQVQTLTLHRYLGCQAPLCDLLGCRFSCTPIRLWAFPPHGRDLKLWGAAAAGPKNPAITEEAEPELNMPLCKKLDPAGQGHGMPLYRMGRTEFQHRL